MNESSPRRARKAPKKLAKENVSACQTKQFNRPGEDAGPGTLAAAIAGATDAAIDVALRATAGNRTLAARVLAVTPRTLYRLLAARKSREGAAL